MQNFIRQLRKCGGLLFVIPLLLFFSISGLAQKTNFSGTWTLIQRTSLTGKNYVNGVPSEMKIVQNSDSMIIERTAPSQNDENSLTKESLLFNGKPSISITPSNNRKSSIIQWSTDGKACTEISQLSAPNENDPHRKITYSWDLSNDGNTLTIVRNDENFIDGETYSMKGVYKKK